MLPLLLLLFLSSAVADSPECPWADAASVSVRADMTTVYVNGTPYAVRGLSARTSFERVLDACGGGATDSFRKWREKRRRINTAAVISVASSPLPVLSFLTTPGFAVWAVVEAAGAPAVRDRVAREIEDEAAENAAAKTAEAGASTSKKRK